MRIKTPLLLAIMFLLIHCKNDRQIYVESILPEPFIPTCNFDFSLCKTSFDSLHAEARIALYTDANLVNAERLLKKCETNFEKKEFKNQNIRKVRLYLDFAFLNLKKRSLSLGVCYGKIAEYESENHIKELLESKYILAQLYFQFFELAKAEKYLKEIDSISQFKQVPHQTINILSDFLEVGVHANDRNFVKSYKTLQKLKSICENNSRWAADYFRSKARLSYIQKDTIRAKENSDKANSLFHKIECINKYDVSRNYSLLSASYEKMGILDSALMYEDSAVWLLTGTKEPQSYQPKYRLAFAEMADRADIISKMGKQNGDTTLLIKALDIFSLLGQYNKENLEFDTDALIQSNFYYNYYYSGLIKTNIELYKLTNRNNRLREAEKYFNFYKSAALRLDYNKNVVVSSEKNGKSMLNKFQSIEQELEQNIFKQNRDLDNLELVLEQFILLRDRKKVIDHIKQNDSTLYQSIFGESNERLNFDLDSTLYLSYFVGGELYNNDQIQLLARYNNTLSLFRIPGFKEISESIDSLYQMHANVNFRERIPSVQNYGKLSFELYKKLFAQVDSTFPNVQDVHLVLDHKLSRLPFESLVDVSPKESGNFSELSYLLSRFNFTYGFTAFPLKKEKSQSSYLYDFLYMGWSDSLTIGRNMNGDISELPGTFKLATFLRNSKGIPTKNKIFTGMSCTKNNYFEYADQAQLVHLDIHGEGGKNDRMDSRLLFRKKKKVNYLYPFEINFAHNPPRTIILSGCETSSGEMQEEEGMFSIARTFYKNGVSNIVSSLWTIPDGATTKLLKSYYQNQFLGLPTSKSLQQAKLNYLSERPLKSFPGYWAGMITYR